MKKYLIFIIVFLLLFVGVQAAQTTQRPSKIYDIDVNLINQEPDPAEPGKYVDVRFKFDNDGTGEARDIEVEILPQYPFSLDPGREAVKSIGTLQSRQKGDVGVIVKYRLRVDINAVEGENELRIKYRIDKGVWIEPEEFMVDIQTHDAILNIVSIEAAPERIKPGDKAILSISFKNLADSLLKDVRVKLSLDSVPLATFGSSNEKTIKTIDGGEGEELKFSLIAEPDAESKLYKVPIEIDYNDELGRAYNKSASFGIVVGSKPELSIGIDSSEIYNAEKTGSVTLKFVNKGVTDIKFLNVRLGSSDKYTTISPYDVYVGNIDSDDYETVDFKLFIKKTDEQKVTLPVTVEYKDANNVEYTRNVNLELKLYSISEAKKLGLVKSNNTVGIILVIIIVIAGLFIYRRWRKSKRKK